MKHKTLAIIGLTAGLAFACSSALANPQANQTLFTPKHSGHRMHQGFKSMHKRHRKPVTLTWHRALNSNKHLSKQDAKVLTQAAIILYGNKNTQITDITAGKGKKGRDVYFINLKNPQSDSIQKIIMNAANGRMHAVK